MRDGDERRQAQRPARSIDPVRIGLRRHPQRVFIADRIWQRFYEPLGSLVQRVADAFSVLQQGRIATYLLYSFVTLVVLLAVVL